MRRFFGLLVMLVLVAVGSTPLALAAERHPVVAIGSSGGPVSEAQTDLNLWIAVHPETGLVPLVVDGDFGPRTEHAVRVFQAARGLVVDGIVGPQTWAALDAVKTPSMPRKPTTGPAGVGPITRVNPTSQSPTRDTAFVAALKQKYQTIDEHQIDAIGIEVFGLSDATGKAPVILSYELAQDEYAYLKSHFTQAQLRQWGASASAEMAQHWPGRPVAATIEWVYYLDSHPASTPCHVVGPYNQAMHGWLHLNFLVKTVTTAGRATPTSLICGASDYS
ncbi:MAG: hypothetical protein NVS4B8_23320 [Herpetosiphon sp.]